MLLVTITTTIQNPDKSGLLLLNTTTITIGGPFYKQTGYAFYGNDTTNGLNFKDSGKALIMHRDGGAIYIQGNAVITTDNSSEKASYTFQEIGHLSPDGTIKANGAAFLNNVVAICQRTDIYKGWK